MSLALTQTTLSAAITANQTVFAVASATNLSAPVNGVYQKIYVIDPGQMAGELMNVVSLSGTTVTVARLDEFKTAHANGSLVLIASVDPTQAHFYTYNPVGATAADANTTQPWVNVATGEQWIWSTVTTSWVPGWQNPGTPGVAAAVASVAGTITPSGPLFHITGALAITGFVLPIGYTGAPINVIPDGTFTWTTAVNIALAGTAVVSKTIEFTYDTNTAKFYPSVVA